MSRTVTRRKFVQAAALSGLAAAAKPRWTAGACPSANGVAGEAKGFTQFVDVFIGTGGHGHTFPGATVPFGMVQLSPDTEVAGWDACSGYHYSHSSILGFSHTHLSGTGVGDMLDVLVVPATGPVRLQPGTLEHPETGYRSRFDHADE